MNPASRCGWCGSDPLYVAYHDAEWGVPCHDERRLFEFLVLEAAQAGLSWLTVLRKRENYRRLFHAFDYQRIARYGEQDVARLLQDAGIIRNEAKIRAAIGNARATCDLHEAGSSLAALFWGAVDGRPRRNAWRSLANIPATTPESEALSRELKRRGFRFVGPTVIYAHMQAAGMVNDHLTGCFRYREVRKLAARGE